MARRSHLLWVLLFFLATTTVYTYPLLFELPRAAMVGGGDYLGETAQVAWNAHQVVRNPLGLFDSRFFYPNSNTVAYGSSLFFPGLVGAPLLALTGQPLLVTNALMFTALMLSGVFTYLLALSLTERAIPSLLAGVVFAYTPYRMDHLGQFTVQMGVFLPLTLWAFVRFFSGGRWRDLGVLVGSMWAQTLSSMYFGFAQNLLLLGLLAALLLLRPRQLAWRLVARGAVGIAALAALLLPFLLPYWRVHAELGLHRDVGEAEWFGMDLLSILDPGLFNTLYGGGLLSLGRSEGGLFPGFVVLALVPVAFFGLRREPAAESLPSWTRPARRSLAAATGLCLVAMVAIPWVGGINLAAGSLRVLRARDLTLPVNLLPALALAWVGLEGRRRRAGPLDAREWVIVLAFLSVLTYCLTLTPSIRVAGHVWGTALFRWVYFHVPGGSAFRAPGRWALIFVLPLALLAAFGARALGNALRGHWSRGGPAALLGVLMLESSALPLRWERLPDPPPVHVWLAGEPGDFAILELPIHARNLPAWYMLWMTVHWKRLVNGGVGFVPRSVDELIGVSEPLDPDAFLRAIRAIYPLRYLVVHRPLMVVAERANWAPLRSTPIPGLRLIRSFEGHDVYAVDGPESGVELRRYFSSDLVERHPIAEYELRFDGEDPEVTRGVEVSLNGRRLTLPETEGHRTLRLPPPYRAADRNELRFAPRYVLAPGIAERDAYRIGRTSSQAPADLLVVSAGKEHGDLAAIRVNGLEHARNRRGYNLVALEPRSARILASEVFDTFRSADHSRRLAAFVEGLATGTIVAGAVRDEGSKELTDEAVRALRSLGVASDLRGRFREGHAFVGVKGAAPDAALEAVGPRTLTVLLGRIRRHAFTLYTFTLR